MPGYPAPGPHPFDKANIHLAFAIVGLPHCTMFLALNCGPEGAVPGEVLNHAVTVRGEFPQGKPLVAGGEAAKKVVAADVGTTSRAIDALPKRSATYVMPEGSGPNIRSSPGSASSNEKKKTRDESDGLTSAYAQKATHMAMSARIAHFIV